MTVEEGVSVLADNIVAKFQASLPSDQNQFLLEQFTTLNTLFVERGWSREARLQLFTRVGEAIEQRQAAARPTSAYERIVHLEKQVEELKANPLTLADVYQGVWQPGEHQRGAVVTMGGSLWLCLHTTKTKPGIGPGEDWKLIVKRGQDAALAR